MRLGLGVLFLIFLFHFPTVLAAQSYQWGTPDRVITLPPELKEISGQTVLDADTIACIDDERGIIWLYSLSKYKITGNIVFSGEKNFEGIAWTGKEFYVLKNDATLFKVSGTGEHKAKGRKIRTGIQAEECEGLFYDGKSGSLLISTKSGIKGNADYQAGTRFIYRFNITSEKLSGTPFRIFNPDELRKYAKKHNLDPRGQKIEFIPSEIAVDPATGELYVLSGRERLLYVFSTKGKLKGINRLNPAFYPQAEGLCFLPDGRLVISSEGTGSPAALIILKRL